MSNIKNFEDIQAWQAARRLAGYIYDLTRRPEFSRDFGLCNQIRDATGSVMHNIAKGFESGTDLKFARFLKIARRSAGEVQSELYIALDADYIDDEDLKRGYAQAVEAKKLINGMVRCLRDAN